MQTTILAAGLIAATVLTAAAGAAAPAYRIAETWQLGGDGKWDYPSVDPESSRLFLSRETHVMVVDTQDGHAVGDVPNTAGVHGIALAAGLKRGYISAGRSNEVKVFHLQALDLLATVAVGEKPDAILYEPVTQAVFAFNGHGKSTSVIDTVSNKVIATLPLGGAPEFARADGTGRVFVNIEDTNELATLDARGRRVIGRWPLTGCDGPTGLALDIGHERSFSVCANSKMVILDLKSGRIVATLPIGAGADGAEFDVDTQNAFSANGEGTLTIVHEDDPEHFSVAQSLVTEPGAKNLVLDPARHRLYLPSARFARSPGAPAPKPRGAMEPGSFHVLVIDEQPSAGH